MLAQAFRELRLHPGRFAAVITAIALSIGFLTAVQVFVQTEGAATGKREAIATSRANLAITGTFTDPAAVDRAIAETNGVTASSRVMHAFGDVSKGGRTAYASAFSLPTAESLSWAKAAEGSMPTDAQHIALARGTAKSLDARVGDTIKITTQGDPVEFTVSGLVDEPGLFILPAYLTAEGIARTSEGGGDLPVEWIAGTTDAKAAEQAIPSLKERLAPLQVPDATDLEVMTGKQAQDKAVAQLSRDFDVMKNMLLVFGAIALLVGSIIIANTFAILVAQRRRQTGLLRAVGASRAQVFGRFLAESFVLGLVGSLLGIALGIGLAALASQLFTGSLRFGLEVPWVGLAWTLLVGVVVTLVASLFPLRKALQVSPLEALRPVDSAQSQRRGWIVRAVLTSLLLVAGLALAFLSQRAGSGNLMLAVGGAVLITLGVLGAAPLYVPAMLRGLGRLVGFTPSARLAATNAARNPGRAGATATALMLAVGLIVTLGVGSESIKRTMNAELDERYPVDITVLPSYQAIWQGGEIALPTDLPRKIAAVPGVRAAAGLKGAWLTSQANSAQHTTSHFFVAHTPEMDAALPAPVTVADDDVLMLPELMKELELSDGQQATFTFEQEMAPPGPDGRPTKEPGPVPDPITLTVRSSQSATDFNIVSPATLTRLAPDAPMSVIVASVQDRGDAAQVNSDVQTVVKTEAPTAMLSGGVFLKALIGQTLDVMLLVTSALLGVAALIALIGVGNTLSLSVLERTRESALLRALGLQARSLRWMLLVEALLLAAVGVIVGAAAGMFFGWLGASAVLKEMDMGGLRVAANVPQLVVVVVVAALAAVLASILPGRKAAKATPVEALSDVG